MTVAKIRGLIVALGAIVVAALREWLHAHCDETATLSGLAMAGIVPVSAIGGAWLWGLVTDPERRRLVALQASLVGVGTLAASGWEDYLRAHCEAGAQLGDVVQAVALAALALAAHQLGVRTPVGPPQ